MEDGQGLVEYVLLILLIVIMAIVILAVIGAHASEMYSWAEGVFK